MFASPQKDDQTGRFYGLKRITKLAEGADPRAESIVGELEAAVKSFGYKDLELLEKMPAEQLHKIVKTLPMISKAKDELKRVRQEIDTWFDVTKRAFQDLYERRMRLWSFLISAVIVVIVNANVIEIYREFSTDKILRDAAIAWADRVISASKDSILRSEKSADRDTTSVQKSDAQIQKEIEQKLAEIQSVVNAKGFQLLRWREAQRDALLKHWFSVDWIKFVVKSLLGWLGMTLLVSLGAPFWYDFLKTVMGIKNSFKNQTGGADGGG
jgi:hypothetical protein